MKHDEIDRILGEDPPLTPSSGFTASVMEAVRRKAEGPEPLAFPWRRVAPGLAICLLAIVVTTVGVFSGQSGAGGDRPAIPPAVIDILLAQASLWLAGTLLGSWILVRMSLRLAGFER